MGEFQVAVQHIRWRIVGHIDGVIRISFQGLVTFNNEKRFKGAGALKLLLVSGVFIQEWDNAVDVLVVGDRLNNRLVDRAIRSLESEIGRELTYAVFDTSEFEYRVNIYDKLVRDILDFPHEKIVNRLGI